MLFFKYIDSIGCVHHLKFEAYSYPNLMEFIRDNAYEDWGDCRGRAWCGTCHVKVSAMNQSNLQEDEKSRLSQLSNLTIQSRLACQIPLDKNIKGLGIAFIGDD